MQRLVRSLPGRTAAGVVISSAVLSLLYPLRLAGQSPVDWLPDIIVRSSDLHDHDIRTNIVPGRRHLRLSNATANIGLGKLHLYGVLPGNGDGTQNVRQRVFREDGTFHDEPAGLFVYHPQHDHIHIEDWCRYRLREVLPDNGVGAVVAEGEKVSFCILDLAVYDNRLPNFVNRPQFISCGSTVQGLSVGWTDIYSKDLPGQNIDITGLPDGFYWLESQVDPENYILESNDENNATRIRVTIGNPPNPPDLFEPNDSPGSIDSRPPGGPNSPNLGPCNPKRAIKNLSIQASRNDDYFKFYVNSLGGPRNFVRIDFDNARGNLDLQIFNQIQLLVGDSTGDGDIETVSLEEMPKGWYYARVFGKNGALNLNYMLTVVPPRNDPPSINVLTPPAGDTTLIHGNDLYSVTWDYSDPEDDKAWVTVYFNAEPEFDGNQILLPTTLNTDAEQGFSTINSAEVPPGTYWVHCSITDGGTTRGSWSEGTVTFVEISDECRADPGASSDCNGNAVVDECEINLGLASDCNDNLRPDACDIDGGGSLDGNGNDIPDECERPSFHRGDSNHDGNLDVTDAISLFTFLFLGGAVPPCMETVDTNNDGARGLTDGVLILNYLFLGGSPPASPGPSPQLCGPDPDPIGTSGDLGCELYERC